MIQLSIQPVTQEFLDGAKVAHHALFIQVTMQDDICQPGFAQHSALRIKEAEINFGEIIDEQQHKRPVDWVVVGKAAMIPPGVGQRYRRRKRQQTPETINWLSGGTSLFK